jgi:hypothetical protein
LSIWSLLAVVVQVMLRVEVGPVGLELELGYQ